MIKRSILARKVDEIKPADWDIEVPEFKIKGREWLKSQVSRAFLPKYFPNYKKYLWIDADAWVNSWEAIELYFKGCENNKLSIATSADRAYGRVLRAEWFLEVLQESNLKIINMQNHLVFLKKLQDK